MIRWLLVLSILLAGFFAEAQKKEAAKKPVPRGRIVNDGAIVYSQANFDSSVLTYLKAGQQLPMSTKVFGGAFYRVQYAAGKTGFIADNDIRPLWKGAQGSSAKAQNAKKKEAAEKAEAPREKSNRKLPMSETQFAGLNASMFKYAEKTMGKTLSDNKTFFGLKLSGPDLLVSGPMLTELNFIFSSGAPAYYEEKTGKPATGLVFMTDFQLLAPLAESTNTLMSFGFGPMFRYAKYNLQLNNNNAYAAEDMSMGAVFSLGYAFRMGSVALRGEGRYHWEKTKYMGAGLALQMGY